MKGIIATISAAVFGLGLLTAVGCDDFAYHDLVDPCYPERYEFLARQEVNASMAPQMHNGDILNRTVWNYHFEPGSDKLTPGGQEQLKYMVRMRPHPEPVVFLQTAEDITYDPSAHEKYTIARAELNSRRCQAVHSFLTAYTAGAVPCKVVIHDQPEVGFAAAPLGGATYILPNKDGWGSWQKFSTRFSGKLPRAETGGAAPTLGGLGTTGGSGGGGSP